MIINNITPPQVWSASARSLTNFGSGALAVANNQNQTLAGAASIDLRTSAGVLGMTTVGVKTGAAATQNTSISLNDGTTRYVLAVTANAAAAFAGFTLVNTQTVGLFLANNDATNAATWTNSAFLLTI